MTALLNIASGVACKTQILISSQERKNKVKDKQHGFAVRDTYYNVVVLMDKHPCLCIKISDELKKQKNQFVHNLYKLTSTSQSQYHSKEDDVL